MTRATLSALLSHWRRHPLQLAMLLLGLSLATGLWTGVQAINTEARAAYATAAGVLGQDRLARITGAGGAAVPLAEYVALRRAGWAASPVLEGRATLGATRVTLLGVDLLTLPAAAAPPGTGAGEGAAALPLTEFLRPPGLGLAAPETLAAMGDAAADLLPLRAQPGLPPGTVIADIGTVARILGVSDSLSRLLIDPASAPPPEALPTGLVLELPGGGDDLARLTDSFHLNLSAFGLLSFAVGLFIVHSATGLALEQRRSMFRTLRALGVPLGRLMGLLVLELGGLALLAGAAGVALGWLVAATLLPDVAATLGGLYGAAVPGALTLRPEWALAGLAIAMAGTLGAAAGGLWQVARLPVLAPAQPRAWSHAAERRVLWQGVAAAGLAAVALGLGRWGAVFPGGLAAGFALLGAVLLAAALALPVVLVALLAMAGRLARGPVAQWVWADARQQVPGLSLALMALLLALATNLGVGTMVSSFRATFTGWLDQRLAAELYVTARTEAEAQQLRDRLADDPRVLAVLPVWRAEAGLHGQPGDIYGMADHATYRDNWPLLAAAPDAWARLARGDGVLVNEQLARRADLWPGAVLHVASPGMAAGIGALDVVGVYSDYGNPRPQAIIGIDAFTAAFPAAPRLSHALRTAPQDAAALREDLIDGFGLPPDRVTDQAAAKALSLAIFERTFAVTAALNVLTLGVAALALVSSLVTLSGMRLAQVAPLWALGLTRRRLAMLEAVRTLALAAFTALAAIPAGLMLAWVLLAVVNVEAFGWRLPMQVFAADWARLGLWALVAVAAAAAVPVWRLARVPPERLLRVFANER